MEELVKPARALDCGLDWLVFCLLMKMLICGLDES